MSRSTSRMPGRDSTPRLESLGISKGAAPFACCSNSRHSLLSETRRGASMCAERCLLVLFENAGGCGRSPGLVEAMVLKLTVDSSEPLEDAVRALGALYGVTLVISHDAVETGRSVRKSPNRRSDARGRKRSSQTRARTGGPVARRGGAARANSRSRADGAAGSAEVRAWARQEGLAVRERGRIPAAVKMAYQEAQGRHRARS
jgi:hypothetical protein